MPADVSGAHAETSSLRTGGLAGAVWALDAESHWTAEDLVEAEPGRAVLSRHLRAVLGVLLDHLPRFTGGYVALAGLQEDRFTTLATVKVDPAAIDPLGKRAEDGGPAAILNACANMEAAVALVPSDDRGVRASRGGTRRTAVLTPQQGRSTPAAAVPTPLLPPGLGPVQQVRYRTVPYISIR